MRGSTEEALAAELRRLGTLSLDELRAAWRTRLGGEPPRLRSADLVARALAHELQVRAFGDLPAPLRRRAADLARRFQGEPDFRPAPEQALKAGCSLVREWGGQRHEVKVLDDGFSYRGEPVRSLSEAALRITGTKWNGRLFFGLSERGPRKGAAA
jgi:hypothetical protein